MTLVRTRILRRACLTKRKTNLRTLYISSVKKGIALMHMHRSPTSQIYLKRGYVLCKNNQTNNLANQSYCQYLSRTLSTSWTVSEIFSEFKFSVSLGKVSIYVTTNTYTPCLSWGGAYRALLKAI